MSIPNLLDSLPEVARWIDRSRSILLGLDFDGTLTPLCPSPDDAILAEPVRALLERLGHIEGVAVIILSGRSLRDVAAKVGVAGLVYAGNHGLEIEGPGLSFLEPTAAATAPALEQVTQDLQARLASCEGVFVEPKRLTTSVHYRLVPTESWSDLAGIVHEAVAADASRFILTSGHRVWEIRPRVSWHKGLALDWTNQRLGDGANRLIFYLGDDRTDEDAFASLAGAISVKIGDHRTPTHARYWLPDPDSVCRFLDWLACSSPLQERASSQR
jgi:trehalose 6-phosphate phosphatase